MSYYPSLKEAKVIIKNGDYKTIPISYRFNSKGKDSIEVLKILKNYSKNVFILESAEDEKKWGRYTFIGYNPKLEITCLNSKVSIKAGTKLVFEDANPQDYIRKIIRENKSPFIDGLPTFTGGLVGYFSYDFIKYSEKTLNLNAQDEEEFKDADLMLFDKIIAFDNLKKEIILIVNVSTEDLEINYNKGLMDLEQMKNLIRIGTPKKDEEGLLLNPLKPLFNKEEFCQMVENAKKHIIEGDIFQVVLSNRLVAKFQGSLLNTYLYLRDTNPSPYMFYFYSNDIEIAGASPETLVKLEKETLHTFPLAGTRPRGNNPEEDLKLEKELLTDEKECAEHNMLVDLGRNDIGKVSKFGTVEVEKYMSIEKFSCVMHIGSTVKGIIDKNKDAIDAIESVLPAGTLSGAPKVKACQIINDLENNKRGIYGGAIGYINFNGNMDMCIAIRLAFKKKNKVFVRSGAGIVADSVAENEYEECINKAKAVVNALKEEV